MPRFIIFDWDDLNEAHIAQHRVTPEEVEDCYFNPHVLIPKPKHPGRYYLYGQTDGGRYLFVVLDDLGNGVVRPVTARGMKRKEPRYYQQQRS